MGKSEESLESKFVHSARYSFPLFPTPHVGAARDEAVSHAASSFSLYEATLQVLFVLLCLAYGEVDFHLLLGSTAFSKHGKRLFSVQQLPFAAGDLDGALPPPL